MSPHPHPQDRRLDRILQKPFIENKTLLLTDFCRSSQTIISSTTQPMCSKDHTHPWFLIWLDLIAVVFTVSFTFIREGRNVGYRRHLITPRRRISEGWLTWFTMRSKKMMQTHHQILTDTFRASATNTKADSVDGSRVCLHNQCAVLPFRFPKGVWI